MQIFSGYFNNFLYLCAHEAARELDEKIGPNRLIPDKNPRSSIRLVQQEIARTYNQNIDIEALAEKTGYSKRYLNVVFKEQVKMAILQYIHERRIQAAMYNLRTTEKQVVEIALETGYKNLSFLTISLKSWPGEHRLSIRSN